jgi:hypothetical protein
MELKGDEYLKTTLQKRIVYYTVLIITALCFLKPLQDQMGDIWRFLDKSLYVEMRTARAKGIRFAAENTVYEDAIRYIQAHVREKEKIFVGNQRHDRILMSDIMFYFLSERDSATRYHQLDPGLATTKPKQDYIIDELEKNTVEYMVLASFDSREPNLSSVSSEVYILDEYIRTEFEPIKTFGQYEIWKRKK